MLVRTLVFMVLCIHDLEVDCIVWKQLDMYVGVKSCGCLWVVETVPVHIFVRTSARHIRT